MKKTSSMKKLFYLIALFTLIANNAYQQSTGGFGKDSLPGCRALFDYYYNDSIETFAEAYPYQFVDYSYGDIVKWEWNFGDGTTSNEKNPMHFYKHNGDTFLVCLSITTSNACQSTHCINMVVSPPPGPEECYAYFYAYPDSFVDCLCLRFQGVSNGNTTAWHWDFGDGTVSEEQVPLHHFPAAGIYNVCLTVSNASGQTCSYCQEVYYETDPGQGNCSTSFDIFTLKCNPPKYQFLPAPSDSINWYYWDFGDGQQSYEVSPVHAYDYSGYYTVCLTTKTFSGCKANYCTTQYFQGSSKECKAYWICYPIDWAVLSSQPADKFMPYPDWNTYMFYDQSSGWPLSWHWTFSDGTESFDQNPYHTFPGPGIYTVCLKINTADSCTSTYCDSVYVGIQQPCGLYGTVIDYTGLDGCGPLIQLDNGMVLDPVEIVPEFKLVAGQRVRLSYTEVTDQANVCMAGILVRIDCIEEIPTCSAVFWHYALPWVSSLPPLYQFESDSSQQVISWLWDFGDGTMVNEKSPMHRFEYSGYYTVCLTVFTASGCSNTYCETSYYEGRYPQPGLCNYRLSIQTEMIVGPVYSCDGKASASLYDISGNEARAQSYWWSTGSEENHVEGLCNNTEYQVTVVDPEGCAITGSFIFYGSGTQPGDTSWGAWNYEKNGADYSFNIPVYDEGYYCVWDFGDGTVTEGFNALHTYTEEGEYIVVVTIYDSTGNIVYTKQFTVDTRKGTGISNHSRNAIQAVYPVPASDKLYVVLPQESAAITNLMIYNSSGQQVLARDIESAYKLSTLVIDVNDLPSGIYYGILKSQSNDNLKFRFIK
jgi:PKD repeat protein